MLEAGGGRIINIASIAGKEGNPTLVPYSTAKAGVIGRDVLRGQARLTCGEGGRYRGGHHAA